MINNVKDCMCVEAVQKGYAWTYKIVWDEKQPTDKFPMTPKQIFCGVCGKELTNVAIDGF